MNVILKGIENIEYISKKSGNSVKGVSLHVVSAVPSNAGKMHGCRVDTIFISADKPIYSQVPLLSLDSEIELVYKQELGDRYPLLVDIVEV